MTAVNSPVVFAVARIRRAVCHANEKRRPDSRRPPLVRSCEAKEDQAFLVKALHQPLADTCLPAKIAQPPAASPGLP